MIRSVRWLVCLAILALLITPSRSFAQSAIAGVVKDATGAVMPGVTVEVASPVLIEKTRSALTDAEGLYKIIDLRPGEYTVTFALEGFGSVKRAGIELPASFTATVNAEMKVGALDEMITVTGQAPLVDTQSVTAQKQFSNELLNSLPTARSPQSYVPLIPGVVGGLNVSGVESRSLAIHGSRANESVDAVDGFADNLALGVGAGNSTFYMNPVNIQEINVEAGGTSAERQFGGVYTNIIPKEGANRFNGIVYGAYADQNLAADNLTDDLRARGLTAVSGLKKLWDFAPAVGGPIVKDKLWFFSSYRNSDLIRNLANLYYNKTPRSPVYTPDLDNQAHIEITDGSYSTRLTWQASPRNKFNLSYELQPHVVFQRGYTSLVSPEATAYTPYNPNYFAQAVWKSPVSNRMLVEGGFAMTDSDYNGRRQNEKGGVSPEVDFNQISYTESSTGLVWGSVAPSLDAYGHHINRLQTFRGAVSYVTGAHAFKAGATYKHGLVIDSFEKNSDYGVTLLSGTPRSITEIASPYQLANETKADLGIFVQDQWAHKRFTFNFGVRDDYYNAAALAQDLPATRFVPARSYPEIPNVPNWNDVSPRLGVAYDVFGDGKTAIKWSMGKYVIGYGNQIALANNPVTTSVLQVTRTWTDLNSNFIPDCDLTNPQQNLECAQISDTNFGQNNPRATRWDPALLTGSGKRDYNWETSIALQRELFTGVSASVAYFRRWYDNFRVTDNEAVLPTDYTTFCITEPADPRLPSGGGQQQCGYYDLNPNRFGQVTNFVNLAENYGKQTETFDGIDLTGSARFRNGAQISGGASIGRTETNSCFVVDSPQQLKFCDVKPPFQPNIKFLGIYPLPWGVQASAALQSLPGPRITATYVATNAQIFPSLGRNLSAGATATASLELIQPGTMFSDRVNQTDLRLTKNISVGKSKINAMVDIFNLFNSSDVQTLNVRYGPQWQQPTQILEGRYFKFSAQLNF